MHYDFETLKDRSKTDSLKWDIKDGELPMWVADMDFVTAPEIQEAILARANEGIYGYGIIPDEWANAYSSFWEKRHHYKIPESSLIFATGVIPILSSAVRKLTTPAENVLILTPVYNIFYNCIRNNGRTILESPLKLEGREYSIDWDDFEEKCANPQTSLLIFCNPHNPIGKIWDRDTLARIGEICKKYDVIVLSDEIHCDITIPGKEYIPFAAVSDTCKEISLTAIAASKCFNLAGLQSAAVFSENKQLHHKIYRALNTDEVAEPNAFAISATIAALNNGQAWLDELRQYLSENRKYAEDFVANEIKEATIIPGEATYLLWFDMRNIQKDRDDLASYIRKETGLWVSDGAAYGSTGKGFLRVNIACPRRLVEDGMKRLKQGIEGYIAFTQN